MSFQTAGALVTIKRQAGLGAMAPDAAGTASQLHVTSDSPSGKLDYNQIQSNEQRTDLLTEMPGMGTQTGNHTYNGEIKIGKGLDLLLEAILRGTWSASAALVTANNGAAFTSLRATANNQLTLTGTGSFITQGVKAGDVIRLTNMTSAANSNTNLRVLTVTANVLTLLGTQLTVEGAGSTNAVLTRLKKVVTPSAPVEYWHTIEEYFPAPIDQSIIWTDAKLVGLSLSLKPDGKLTYTATFMSRERQELVSGSSPYFTTPAQSTGLSLDFINSTIGYAGADGVAITGLDLNFRIEASTKGVLGTQLSPDVFTNNLLVDGSVTGMRSDFANLSRSRNQTEFELHVLLQEPGAAPRPCVGIFLPRVKLGSVEAPLGSRDGPIIETLPLMTGPLASSATYDGGTAAFFSSVP